MEWLNDGSPLKDVVDHSWNEASVGVSDVFENR